MVVQNYFRWRQEAGFPYLYNKFLGYDKDCYILKRTSVEKTSMPCGTRREGILFQYTPVVSLLLLRLFSRTLALFPVLPRLDKRFSDHQLQIRPAHAYLRAVFNIHVV